MEKQRTNVEELIKRLPSGYEQACIETKTTERKRGIKTPENLIRILLIYLTGGYSQTEISVIALQLGIGKFCDSAFTRKFAKCRDWLAWMVSQIVPGPLTEYNCLKEFSGCVITALDATEVSEKGRSGQVFRMHYAIDLLKMCSLAYKITAQKTGETLLNFDIKKNWLILADRVYGTLTGIEHCLKSKANFVIRLKHNAFKMFDANGKEINLLSRLKNVKSDAATDIEVFVKLPEKGLTKLRVCISKIPDEKLPEVERRNKRKASKKQITPSAGALTMSNYVVVITSLPDSFSAKDILELYRYRWQVEIYFKRLKSILDFGNVPLHREDSIHTWLNGKLSVSLLLEQMISEVSFSPCDNNDAKHLARDSNSLQNASLQPFAFEQIT
jgi:hypothetical protein